VPVRTCASIFLVARSFISSQSKRKKLLFVRLIDNGALQIVPLTSPDLVSSSPVITTDLIGTVWGVDLDAQLIVIVIILSSFDIMDLTMALSLLRIYSPLHQRLQPATHPIRITTMICLSSPVLGFNW
jgi:hypothetical protein